MPRVAAKLKAAMASDVMKFDGSGADIVFTRPMWAGNVIADVKLSTPVKAFTVRATEFPARGKGGAAAEVKRFSPATDATAAKTKFVDFKEVKSARPELTEAKVVVSGGRGTKGDFKEIEALADELGAAVGATRAVCDAGWVPNDLPGRPDRQGRGAAALHRGGHQRRHPAPGGHEGLARPSSPSTRTRRRPSSRWRTTAWWRPLQGAARAARRHPRDEVAGFPPPARGRDCKGAPGIPGAPFFRL